MPADYAGRWRGRRVLCPCRFRRATARWHGPAQLDAPAKHLLHGLGKADDISPSRLYLPCNSLFRRCCSWTSPRFKVPSNGISPAKDTDSYAIASRLEKAIAKAEGKK